ncbi:hypothetical protein Pcinc_039575 [Petrolisthes cinctipes]|uniref:Uncharacterized protein n=1 Tax=Petrolisthes cinctipes TaxID=88211 RepID=A0AAE1BPJ6_PETCI|nr:hypothetical protein Pcinc_039575 [Petrolisthes cinctipes]
MTEWHGRGRVDGRMFGTDGRVAKSEGLEGREVMCRSRWWRAGEVRVRADPSFSPPCTLEHLLPVQVFRPRAHTSPDTRHTSHHSEIHVTTILLDSLLGIVFLG